MELFNRNPLARRPQQRGEDTSTSEVDKLAKIMQQWRNGEISPIRLFDKIRQLANHRHESQEGKFEIDRAVMAAVKALEALYKADRTSLNPPTI
jgi:hypothetical protein